MSEGLTIEEYRERMMVLAQEILPKESKSLLKTETQKLKRHLQKYAKQHVPVSRIPASEKHRKYHASFKVGKTYRYDDSLSKRVFNNSRHARYVEGGRKIARGYRKRDGYKNAPAIGRTPAYAVYKTVKAEFDPIYKKDLDDWIEKMIAEGKL